MSAACDDCLRRGALIASLAPRIQGAIARPGQVTAGVLALSDEDLLEALAGPSRASLERMLEQFDPAAARASLERADCEAVCRHSFLYPVRLGDVDDRPNPLYVRGGLDRLDELLQAPGVAIVGGRKSSEYGRAVAHEIGRGLSAAGATVISGLALGIDGASHRGALEAGGRALAVLGCGPDVPYPLTHRRLYRDVVREGVIVTELAPGTEPRPWAFPARNRIMAALAEMVVVVEAQERSGSLITAEFALELNRELAAVPGQVTARLAAGSNSLLRDGATVVRCAEDILDGLFHTASHDHLSPPPTAISPELEPVLAAIEVGDSFRRAAGRAGMSASALRAALGRLEGLGLIRTDGRGGYERCAGRPAEPTLCEP